MQRASVTVGVLVGLLALTGCGTTAPAPCQIQSPANGGYLVRLLRTPGQTITPACDVPTGTPSQIGDNWLFDVYETDPTNPSVFTVIGYSTIIGLPDPNVGSSPLYGRAQFTTANPAADSTCALANMTMNGTSAGTGTYAISNFIWQETAVYLGTEFKADVTYTIGACSATYAAQAITPPVQCTANADCDPFAQPFSSGINPDYNQNCIIGQTWTTQLTGDPGVGICFFQEQFPSTGGYKSGS